MVPQPLTIKLVLERKMEFITPKLKNLIWMGKIEISFNLELSKNSH